MPQVTVVVLNWNGLRDTLECLESLSHLDYPRYRVVVVDNGSTDGSPAAIRARFPEMEVIETGENLGYAGGNNVGLRYALAQGADYVLLLNNDTEVAPDMLRRLVEAAEGAPGVGVAGPTICYHDRPEIIWSAGGGIDRRRGRTWMIGLDEPDDGRFGAEPREVDFVTGCAMLVRAAALREAGLLDERFFMYYEEVEWCARIRRAGYRIIHVPTAKMWHKIFPQAQSDSALVHYYMSRNRLLFLRLTGAGVRSWLLTLAEDLRTMLAWSLRPRWRHKGPQRRAMLQAILDAGRGRWGRRALAGE